MTAVWTHELLDALRQVGDPRLDATGTAEGAWRSVAFAPPQEGFEGSEEVRLLQTWRRRMRGALPDKVERDDPYWTHDPPSADDGQLALAQELFVLNGGEIAGALLMSALPATYASRTGAEVLAHTGELNSNARRRIAETAQLVVDVLFPDETELYAVGPVPAPSTRPTPASLKSRSLKPGGHGYSRVLSTRLTHAVIRELITAHGWDPKEQTGVPRHEHLLRGVPINQEDLLGVLGTFTISVIDAVEKLGVHWTAEAQQAYIDLWDRVGALLGIGTAEVTDLLAHDVEVPAGYEGRLRPRTVAELRELTELIIERSWPIPKPQMHVPPFESMKGKVLARALLDELEVAMPRGMERLPLMVMRYLVRPEAQELLGLGGGGVLDTVAQVPYFLRRQRTGPLWFGERVVGTGMRMLANEVSRRAFVHFIHTRADDENASDFWFPAISAEHRRRPTFT
jgi:hypothetical protein